MTVILVIVPQIKVQLSRYLRNRNHINGDKLYLYDVVGIYGVTADAGCTKFRFRTSHGTDEVIIANENFTVWSIEP